MKYYLIDRFREKPRETDEATALSVLTSTTDELAIGPVDLDFVRNRVLIVAQYANEWRILGPRNETLATVRKDVYAPQVVFRTADAILRSAKEFHSHQVVTGL